MNNLAIVKTERFEDVVCDFWKNENQDIFMTINQLSQALGYSSKDGVEKILSRNEYLKEEEFSTTYKLSVLEGKRTVSRNMRVFTEDGIYEITMLATTEKAKIFRSWVRKILKGLRSGELKIQNNYTLPTTYKEALIQLLATVEEKEQLEEQNRILLPKAETYDVLCSADNSQDMNSVAKSFGVGRNKLFEFLRRKEILMSNNLPYQKYCNSDYFEVREYTIQKGYRTINQTQTLVTAKGLDYIGKLLKEVEYIL